MLDSKIKSLNTVMKLLAQEKVRDFAVFYKCNDAGASTQVYIMDEYDCSAIKEKILKDKKLIGHVNILPNGFSVSDGVTLDYLMSQVEELYKEAEQ